MYNLCKYYGIEPFIDLNPKNITKSRELINLDNNGVPICRFNLPMAHWGFNKDRYRIKWRCPIISSKKSRKKYSECPFREECSTSEYGRTVYTYPESNPRLFTKTVRKIKSS